MPENVKTRTRTGRRSTAHLAEVTTADSATTDDTTTEAAVTEATEATTTDGTDPGAVVESPESPAGPETAGAVVGWADAVPWLALRWGAAPTAAEMRFAPVVWRMLTEQAAPGQQGRTALQMAAEAELAGYADLDPTVLAKVLGRYERAGVARTVTDGRLVWWSVADPAEIVADAQESARTAAQQSGRESGRVGASAARTGRAGVASRVGDGTAPAGGLRELVAAHLAAHPFEDFSPSQVAKVLGRSSGAVANALERLTDLGTVLQTSMSPRRYQHHPDTDGAAEDGADAVTADHGGTEDDATE